MGKSLLIVESPTKVKTLKKFIGKDFIVKASVGHVKDLPKSKLGVDVDNNFAPEYITIRGKGKILSELKAAAKTVDTIYLAPDPDREGEAIAHHIGLEVSKLCKGKTYRVMFNEITKRAVTEAIAHPTELNVNKVNAQQARRILDRLVGYTISPILSKCFDNSGLSAGRVQSVALRMVCDREKEIKGFDPKEYWYIVADLQGSSLPAFPAKLFKYGDDKTEIPNQVEAERILKDLEKSSYLLEDIVRKERKRNPSAPFITSTLQQEASRKLGFSPKKTMMLAQRLYEGIELGSRGTVGLITYMRTDSVRMADEAIVEVRKFVLSRYGKEFVPETPNVYKGKKSAQDAHEAIRPTDVNLDPASIKQYLEKDVSGLYELIWSRFVSCQMCPAILDTTQFDIRAGSYLFRANGSVIKFPGFLQVYEEGSDEAVDGENAGRASDRILPSLKKDEVLKRLKITPEQHFTQPPPRFTEASLIKSLEEKGVGRPSTYASIITVIKDREYIKTEDRKIYPTELGSMVWEFLFKHLVDIFSYDFTANMEAQLDKVEDGEAEWVGTLKAFYEPFITAVKGIPLPEVPPCEKCGKPMVEKRSPYGMFMGCSGYPDCKNIRKQGDKPDDGVVEPTDAVCEKCGKAMIIKAGRFGRFMACTGYPECKTTKQLGGKDAGGDAVNEAVEGSCDKCSAPLIMKVGRFGKFIACSKYPDCKFTKPLSIGVLCPTEGCKGYVSARRSKKGRAFYGCSEYPKCTFTSWDKPVPTACPQCQSPYLVEKMNKNEGKSLMCVKEGCKYKVTVAA